MNTPLSHKDVALMMQIIVSSSEQGLIHPESMVAVGELYIKLKSIIEPTQTGEKVE